MSTDRIGTAAFPGERPDIGARAAAARLRMEALVFSAERRELAVLALVRHGRATVLASAAFALLFLLGLALVPLSRREVVRVGLPPTRTVVLEDVELEPPPPVKTGPSRLEQLHVQEVADPPDAAAPGQTLLPPIRRRPQASDPANPAAARAGRARARAATASLDRATASLDRALGDLASSLGTTAENGPARARGRRPRAVGPGRADRELGAVGDGAAGAGSGADVGGSTVRGARVAIGTLAPAAGEDPANAANAAREVRQARISRSNAQLLSVIQKYAAGIQYCYESELKRDERLRGKLVVAMTVTAAGDVREATVVRNSVGSDRLASCALSQIRNWRFPPATGPPTTFQAPFVFTPPQ